jgi:rRNA pseudouridine-1189 N-methylase Emg1 (Nep1/Mra1 family)
VGVQVNTKVRIPRTFPRFKGLMVQLLQKLSIRATNGPDKLLKVGAVVCGHELAAVSMLTKAAVLPFAAFFYNIF